MAAVVTPEYQAHARTCSSCGHVTREQIPDVLRAEIIGERLGATMSYLAASPHVSKRGVEELVETVFGIPVSLGTVANLEQEMSLALAARSCRSEAGELSKAAGQETSTGNQLETSGPKALVVDGSHSSVKWLVMLDLRGSQCGRTGCFAGGTKIRGIVCSDRFSVYGETWSRNFDKCAGLI